jgi:dihydroneopterin aldolase
MLTVSLHGIRLHSPLGLYKEEAVLGNDFEIDVDVWVDVTEPEPWPFVDYTWIRAYVVSAFDQPELLIETRVREIHTAVKQQFPQACKVRVVIRKYHPPMPGEVNYAQVCFEG